MKTSIHSRIMHAKPNRKVKMNRVRRTTLLILLIALLSACGGQAQATEAPELDVDAILTQAVGTFAASLYLTQTAQVTPATETPSASSTATNTPLSLLPPGSLPTLTPTFGFLPQSTVILPTVTGTQYTPTVNPSTLGSGCNNLLLVSDVTVPAGTVMQPNQSFTKTWKVANIGTCNWMFQYHLTFVSGERMGGDSVRLNNLIEPGRWTQLSVGLTAPSRPGTYVGNWRFATQQGTVFGSTLSVSIVVANPTNTPVPPSATPITPSATPVTPSYP